MKTITYEKYLYLKSKGYPYSGLVEMPNGQIFQCIPETMALAPANQKPFNPLKYADIDSTFFQIARQNRLIPLQDNIQELASTTMAKQRMEEISRFEEEKKIRIKEIENKAEEAEKKLDGERNPVKRWDAMAQIKAQKDYAISMVKSQRRFYQNGNDNNNSSRWGAGDAVEVYNTFSSAGNKIPYVGELLSANDLMEHLVNKEYDYAALVVAEYVSGIYGVIAKGAYSIYETDYVQWGIGGVYANEYIHYDNLIRSYEISNQTPPQWMIERKRQAGRSVDRTINKLQRK